MPRPRRTRRRAALLAAVGAVAAGTGLAVDATDALRDAELTTFDMRVDVRGEQSPPDGVVVVGLDDASLEAIDERPPITRRHHARVIDRLRRAGARVIAYDFEFSAPTTPEDDGALLDALARALEHVVAWARKLVASFMQRGQDAVSSSVEPLCHDR